MIWKAITRGVVNYCGIVIVTWLYTLLAKVLTFNDPQMITLFIIFVLGCSLSNLLYDFVIDNDNKIINIEKKQED